jgi:hypothetical protein
MTMDQEIPTQAEMQQQRLDTLAIFCPSAGPYIRYAQMEGEPVPERLFNWREGFQHVLHMLIHTDRALQSLTPGGSEYVHNPDRCVALVKEQQAALHELRVKSAVERTQLAKALFEMERDPKIKDQAWFDFLSKADRIIALMSKHID